jgi:hypothetical protein
MPTGMNRTSRARESYVRSTCPVQNDKDGHGGEEMRGKGEDGVGGWLDSDTLHFPRFSI